MRHSTIICALAICALASGGCTAKVRRYTATCDAVQGYYTVKGFDHLQEPDRSLMKQWLADRKASGIPRAKEVARHAKAFRDAPNSESRVAVGRTILRALRE